MSLLDACGRGGILAVIAFIERGANMNVKNHNGWTPLHYACMSGHTATAVALIERGANLNEKEKSNRTGSSPLCMLLSAFCHSDSVVGEWGSGS